jgi:glycosyltransferase involved in cell wall biosynthesis
MTISAIISTYNEELRIESTIKTLQWCDEIVILDKKSTDRTKEIAEKLGAKVFLWDNTEYDHEETTFLINKCTSEWIISFTASDVIHPNLAKEIKETISNNEIDFDVIYIPFRTYILGIESKRSPWYTEMKPSVFRKSAVMINAGVHDVLQFHSLKSFKLHNSHEFCVFHLTHKNVDTLMERHVRYWRAEARYFDDPDLKTPFRRVVLEIFKVIFKRKSFLLGRDGVMLSFAFISYYMMSYVYKWDKKYNNADKVYDEIRNKMISEWGGKPFDF